MTITPRFGIRFEVSPDTQKAVHQHTGFNPDYQARVSQTLDEMKDTFGDDADGVVAALEYNDDKSGSPRCELSLTDAFGHRGRILKSHVLTIRDQLGDQVDYFRQILEALGESFAEDKEVIIPDEYSHTGEFTLKSR